MAEILPGTTSPNQLIGSCTASLVALRDALADCQAKYAFLSAHTPSDLANAGMDPNTAQGLLSAMADANGLGNIQNTGTDPRPGLTQPYIYAASQREFTNVQ